MSVKHLKAEVARRRWYFRYVPLAEVAMPVEEPSTASTLAVNAGRLTKLGWPFLDKRLSASHYDTVHLHSALGSRSPAPEAIIPLEQRPSIMHQQ